MIQFHKKALLSKTIGMTKDWDYFFCGLCIRQWGLGIIWRKKKGEDVLDTELQMQLQHKRNQIEE